MIFNSFFFNIILNNKEEKFEDTISNIIFYTENLIQMI